MSGKDNKTTPTSLAAVDFIAAMDAGPRRDDAEQLLAWFSERTGLAPIMWGDSIVGYGRYHYVYDSGREGDSMMTGFSPRKGAMSIYILPGYQFGDMPERMASLGRYRAGKSCLNVTRLEHIDLDVLGGIVDVSMAYLREHHDTFDR